LEYKTSATDPSVKVNDELGTAPETVTITDSVSEVYLKVYPYSYKAVDNVTITGDKASSVTLSDSAAKAFGLPPRYGSAQGQKEKETPIPVFLILVGLIIGFALFNKKK
jgi:multisubunit Na+/H+ antiporter MnhC subunit